MMGRIRDAWDVLRGYAAAQDLRDSAAWAPSGSSATAEGGAAAMTVAWRARDAVRNDPYAARIVDLWTCDTFGAGIATRWPDKPYAEVWRRWAESTACDAEGRLDLYGLQALVKAAIPALAVMAHTLGATQVRTRGTMGGSVPNNDPSADYPAALLALDATIRTDRRTISANTFFPRMFTTALEMGEIVTAVRIPVSEKAGYAKMNNPASRYSMADVFVAKGSAGVRVAMKCAGAKGVSRVAAMETVVAANWLADAVAGVKIDAGGMNDDIHGSAEIRAHLVTVMAKHAVLDAG